VPASDNSQSITARRSPVALCTICVAAWLLHTSGPAVSQQARSSDTIQLGAGALPAVGLQAGYLDAGDIFTREATVYGHLRPRFRSDEEELQVSAGIGVGLRIIGGLETMTLIYPRIWDIHVGMRFGPSLVFRRNETEAEQNRRFSLFLDPYARFTLTPRGRQTYFLEAGVQKPAIRAGVWLRI
jgi:hypothetical protein